MLIPVIAAASGAIIYALVVLILGNSPKEAVKKRLNKLAENVELEYVHEAVLSEKKKKRKEKKKARIVSKTFEENLALSGIALSAQEYMILWVSLTVGPGLIGALIGLQSIAVIGLCIVGFVIPPFLVKRSKNKRQLLFNKQLGESLTVMSNCIRSGYSFQQALASVAKEMPPPISTEFSRVVREINYGVGMEEALDNMVAPVKNKDLELLVSAVKTSLQVGANLSEILDTISGTVTDRIALREEVRVCSAQGRISGIIIGLLPAAMFVFLMIVNPDYLMGFINNSIGQIMLVISVILEALGFLLINKIVDIKY